MRIVICEDEVLIAEHLKSIITSFGHTVLGIAHNVKESIRLIDECRPELALLDIRLEGHTEGIDIARYISANYNIPLIFITAMSNKATIDEALAVNPAAYIFKPFSSIEVYAALQIVIKQHQNMNVEDHIIIHDRLCDIKVPENQILYVKSENVYLDIATTHKTYTIRKSLDAINKELKCKCLVKCHRSYIINLNYIDQMQKDHVLIRGTIIPVARQFQSEIREIFKNQLHK